MPDFSQWQWILGTIVTGLLGYLTYRGSKVQARASKDSGVRTSQVDEQQSALDAWKELLDPYRAEVARLSSELIAERKNRLEMERKNTESRIEDKRFSLSLLAKTNRTLAEQAKQIEAQATQIEHWTRLARTIAKFAVQMRDEVIRLGGTAPATPKELLFIQSAEED